MRSGYFKVERKLFDGDDFLWEPNRPRTRLEAWLDLIQTAAYRDGARYTSAAHGADTLARGEFVASLRYLGKRWLWDKMKVSRFCLALEKAGRIVRQRDGAHGTVYLIAKYAVYQGTRDSGETVSETPRETAARQRRDKEEAVKQLNREEVTTELLAADAAIPVPVPAAAAPAALHAEGWSVVRVLAPTITAPPALPLSAADRPGSPADDRPTAPEPAPALFPSGAVPPNRKGAPKAKPRAKVAAVADAVAGSDDDTGSAPAGGKYPHYPQATCAALHTLWLERRGAIDYGRFRKETAPLFTNATPPYTLAELTGALKLCLTVLEERATNPRDRFEWGALTPTRWVERVAQWVKDFRQTQEDVEHLFRLVDGGPRSVGMVA